MKKSIKGDPIRCAECGAGRLIPLTASIPRVEHLDVRRVRTQVRAELKCIVCGKRHVARPSALLAS